MSSITGNNLKISLFGESHSDYIGVTVHGLAAGINLDLDLIQKRLNQRKPTSNLSSARQEEDKFEIISGFFNSYTTGAPLTILIKNNKQMSKDYEAAKNVFRPSHADYVAYKKYDGYNDYRGGGHFSGRLTAPIVALGAICEQILEKKGIIIGSCLERIYNVIGGSFNETSNDLEELIAMRESSFPVLFTASAKMMKKAILDAKKNGDSVGGTIISKVIGIKAGYGEPFFQKVESIIGQLLLSIPAVKGIFFGNVAISYLEGSCANDPMQIENNKVKTLTNNSGGINGGITNGMPIIIQTIIKPTSSIALKQNTIDIEKKENITHSITGRHDPCICHRVIYVQNALISFGILDIILSEEGKQWMK